MNEPGGPHAVAVRWKTCQEKGRWLKKGSNRSSSYSDRTTPPCLESTEPSLRAPEEPGPNLGTGKGQCPALPLAPSILASVCAPRAQLAAGCALSHPPASPCVPLIKAFGMIFPFIPPNLVLN